MNSPKTITDKKPNEVKPLSPKANMIWNAVGSLTYLGCQWIITVLVVRLSTGYDDAGLLALGMTVANIFSPLGYYKIRAVQVSDIEREYSFATYLGLRIVTLSASLIILVVYCCLTCPPNTWSAVLLYGLYYIGPIFVDVLHGEEQLKSRMDYIGISYILRGIASLVTFTFGMAYFKSLDIALILMTVSTFLVIIFYDGRMIKRVGVRSLRPNMDWTKIKRLLIYCAPLVIALFFCYAVTSVPRQLLNNMLGEAALGIYGSIASPILIIQMCGQYIYYPLLTMFAERYKEKDAARFLQLLLRVSLGMLGVSFLLGVLLSLFGEPIFILLYGDSIAPYLYLIIPLVVCTIATAFIWFISDLMIVVKQNVSNLIGYAISFGVMLVTMYPLIALYGMNGVSFTVIAAYVAGLLFYIIRIFVLLEKKKPAVDMSD